MKVAEALAAALRDEGVTTVFAVMGDANMRILARLGAETGAGPGAGVRVVYARHETTAVAMADGYARASGTTGVASVTSGPGLVLAALPLLTAARRGMPLLLIAGDSGTADTASLHQLDQRRFVQGLGIEQVTIAHPATAVADLRYALDLAAAGRQPVVLSIPIDIQEEGNPAGYESRPRPEPGSWTTGFVPTAAALAKAASLLRSARLPVVIAGRGAVEDRAGEAVGRLADRLSAPVFTTLPARGLVVEDGVTGYGVAGGYATEEGTRALAAADCVIAIGASLSNYTTVGGTLFPGAKIIRIDRRPPAPSRTVPAAACYLQGTARATVEALTALLPDPSPAPDPGPGPAPDPGSAGSSPAGPGPAGPAGLGSAGPPGPGPARSGIAGAAEPPVVDGLLHPGFVMREVDAAIAEDATVVIGVGHFSSFAVDNLRAHDRRFVFTHDFGSIGQGLPLAIGAAAGGAGSRPVLVEGDASVLMCIQELDTAARYQLPVTVIVLNDEAIGAEYHKLRAMGLDGGPALLPSPDLAALARAFGVEAATVRTPEQLSQALRASRTAGSYLIDVRVSRDVVSTLYRRRHFPAPPDRG